MHQLYLAPEFTASAFGESSLSREAFVAAEAAFLAAFSDLAVTVEEALADDDRVMCRLVVSGTQSGEYAGLPASGRAFEIDGFSRDRFVAGQVVEHILLLDLDSLKAQLGATVKTRETSAKPRPRRESAAEVS
jgi:predicted ester cyclase